MNTQKYRHYKGGEYEMIGEGRHSESLEELVFYRALYDTPDYPKGSLWARPKNMFFDEVEVDGQKVKRFEKIS